MNAMLSPAKKQKLELKLLQLSLVPSSPISSVAVKNPRQSAAKSSSVELIDTDQDLNHAIQITNKFLTVPIVIETLKQFVHDAGESEELITKWNTCARKLRETKVAFKPRTGKLATSWIEEVDSTRIDIVVHHFFQHRLRRLRDFLIRGAVIKKPTKKASMKLRSTITKKKEMTKEEIEKEIKIIVFFMAIGVLHEVAHLMIRFSGKLQTPSDFKIDVGLPDAGNFLELNAFRGVVKIFSSPAEGQWSKEDSYKGVGTIGNKDKRSVFSEDWIEDWYNMNFASMNLNFFIRPKYAEDDSSVKNTKPLKGLDENEDDDGDDLGGAVAVSAFWVDLEDLGVARCGVHLDD